MASKQAMFCDQDRAHARRSAAQNIGVQRVTNHGDTVGGNVEKAGFHVNICVGEGFAEPLGLQAQTVQQVMREMTRFLRQTIFAGPRYRGWPR